MQIARAALVLVAVSALAACNKGGGSSPDSAGEPSSGGLLGSLKSAIAPNTTPFEGTMDLKIVDPGRGGPGTVSLEVKGSKLRFNLADPKVPGGTAGGVLDLKT